MERTLILCLVGLFTLALIVITWVGRRLTTAKASDADGTTTTTTTHPTVAGGGSTTTSCGGGERFSLTRARGRLPTVDKVPEDFLSYKFDMAGKTGVHEDWDSVVTSLSKMCKMLIDGLSYVIHGGRTNADLVLAVTENFIVRYKVKIDAASTSPPWGSAKDWETFSGDSASMLAHYLMLPADGSPRVLREPAIDLILHMIENPTKSKYQNVGTDRRVAILHMAGPWILAKYLRGVAEAAAEQTEYKAAMRETEVPVRFTRNVGGTHLDHSYFDVASKHVDYRQLFDACDPKFAFLFGLDGKLSQALPAEHAALKNILLHPTVRCGNVGLLGVRSDLACDANATSDYGVRVMPFSGYIRYFTKDRQFSMRAQKKDVPYYIATADVKNMAQYWVQYRNLHDANSSTATKFPAIGFINRTSQSGAFEPTLRTDESIKPFKPKSADKQCVASYKHYGVLYQEYEIEEFGKFSVNELVVIDTGAKQVEIKLKIVNKETTTLDYMGSKKFVVPAKGTKIYRTTMKMETGAIATEEIPDFPTFPHTLDKNIELKDSEDHKSFLLFDDGVPVVWVPYDWTYEISPLVYAVDKDKREVFKFDTDTNQYKNVKYIKEK